MHDKCSVAKVLRSIPNRLQQAGDWTHQPLVSRHNPKPPGSMVVVQIEPNIYPMDRSGIASSTPANNRNNPSLQKVSSAPVNAQFFRFTALTEINANGWTSAAEISVLPAEPRGGH